MKNESSLFCSSAKLVIMWISLCMTKHFISVLWLYFPEVYYFVYDIEMDAEILCVQLSLGMENVKLKVTVPLQGLNFEPMLVTLNYILALSICFQYLLVMFT